MKRKYLLVLSLAIIVSLAACGADTKESVTEPVVQQEEQEEVTPPADPEKEVEPVVEPIANPEPEVPADDGVINCRNSLGNALTYTKHELVKDFQGKDALAVYFDFTNNEVASKAAMYEFSVKVFQNGMESPLAILTQPNEEYGNTLKQVKTGTTIPICYYYLLSDTTTEVRVEAGELINLSGLVDAQVIKLEDSADKTEVKEEKKEEKKEQVPEKKDKKDKDKTDTAKNVIYTDGSGSTVVLNKFELVEDYNGKPAVAIYFDYTNNSTNPMSFMFAFSTKVFQNGIECPMAILLKPASEYANLTRDIKKGISLTVCGYYSIEDKSDLELEIGPLVDFTGGDKATKIIKIK